MCGKKNGKVMCKKGTFDIGENKGECPESCKYGTWNMGREGICGAECRECGGTLFITDKGEIYCDSCGEG